MGEIIGGHHMSNFREFVKFGKIIVPSADVEIKLLEL